MTDVPSPSKMDGESSWLLSHALRAIDETRDQIPTLGWKLASIVKERIDPETSAFSRTAVERADAVLALFEPSGQPKVPGCPSIPTAMKALEETVWRLLQGPPVDGCLGVPGQCAGGFDGFDPHPESAASLPKDEGCPGVDGGCCGGFDFSEPRS